MQRECGPIPIISHSFFSLRNDLKRSGASSVDEQDNLLTACLSEVTGLRVILALIVSCDLGKWQPAHMSFSACNDFSCSAFKRSCFAHNLRSIESCSDFIYNQPVSAALVQSSDCHQAGKTYLLQFLLHLVILKQARDDRQCLGIPHLIPILLPSSILGRTTSDPARGLPRTRIRRLDRLVGRVVRRFPDRAEGLDQTITRSVKC